MVKRHKLGSTKKLKLSIKQENLTDTKKMFISDFSVTDNESLAVFGPENIKKFIDQKNVINFETFLLTEEFLDIKIDRNKMLEPIDRGDSVIFESVGQSSKEIINWFMENFPNCVFYPITEWFGQKVNTLICILGNPHGKPVGVVKTIN
jgi:hypothetical protein